MTVNPVQSITGGLNEASSNTPSDNDIAPGSSKKSKINKALAKKKGGKKNKDQSKQPPAFIRSIRNDKSLAKSVPTMTPTKTSNIVQPFLWTTGDIDGAGNIAADPSFLKSFRIESSSSCKKILRYFKNSKKSNTKKQKISSSHVKSSLLKLSSILNKLDLSTEYFNLAIKKQKDSKFNCATLKNLKITTDCTILSNADENFDPLPCDVTSNKDQHSEPLDKGNNLPINDVEPFALDTTLTNDNFKTLKIKQNLSNFCNDNIDLDEFNLTTDTCFETLRGVIDADICVNSNDKIESNICSDNYFKRPDEFHANESNEPNNCDTNITNIEHLKHLYTHKIANFDHYKCKSMHNSTNGMQLASYF